MSEWISVDDSLPDSDGVYRVMAEHWRFGVKVLDSKPEVLFENGEFAQSYKEECGEEWREITHWELILEPPK